MTSTLVKAPTWPNNAEVTNVATGRHGNEPKGIAPVARRRLLHQFLPLTAALAGRGPLLGMGGNVCRRSRAFPEDQPPLDLSGLASGYYA